MPPLSNFKLHSAGSTILFSNLYTGFQIVFSTNQYIFKLCSRQTSIFPTCVLDKPVYFQNVFSTKQYISKLCSRQSSIFPNCVLDKAVYFQIVFSTKQYISKLCSRQTSIFPNCVLDKAVYFQIVFSTNQYISYRHLNSLFSEITRILHVVEYIKFFILLNFPTAEFYR